MVAIADVLQSWLALAQVEAMVVLDNLAVGHDGEIERRVLFEWAWWKKTCLFVWDLEEPFADPYIDRDSEAHRVLPEHLTERRLRY